jgi:hypothetical protein
MKSMRRRLEPDDEPARSVDDPTSGDFEPVDERLQRTLQVAHGVIQAGLGGYGYPVHRRTGWRR